MDANGLTRRELLRGAGMAAAAVAAGGVINLGSESAAAT